MTTLLVLAFIVVYSRNSLAVIAPGFILAALVHTTVPGALLAISLLAYWITNVWQDGRISRARLVVPIVIVAVSLGAMAWYIAPPADSLFGKIYHHYRHHLTPKAVLQNARMFLRVTVPIPRPDTGHFWNTNWTDSLAPDFIRRVIQFPATVICLALALFSIIHSRTLLVLFSVGTLLTAGFAIMHGQFHMRHIGTWFILLLVCYWIDRTRGDIDGRDWGGWQRQIRRFFPAVIFAFQPLAVIIPAMRSFQAPFSATPDLVKQVMKILPEASVLSAYPEAFIAPVSAASGKAVYSPQQNRFERFSEWTVFGPMDNRLRNIFPEMPASRLTAQVKRYSSLVLFVHEDDAPAILSKLPEHIAVRQLAIHPKGIVEDEANLCLLLQAR